MTQSLSTFFRIALLIVEENLQNYSEWTEIWQKVLTVTPQTSPNLPCNSLATLILAH